MTEILGKGDAGVQLLRKSESLLAKLAPVLRQGGVGAANISEYEEALKQVIETTVQTAGWVNLSTTFEAVGEGIKHTEAYQHIQNRIKWLTFKHATGGKLSSGTASKVDHCCMYPNESSLKVAYGAAAAADHGKSDSAPRLEVQVDLLEEAFQYVADKNHVQQYKCLETEYGLPLKGLQFSIMRLLCVLYRQSCEVGMTNVKLRLDTRLDVTVLQLLFADRVKNIKYIFRHAEAAGIMIMLANEQYAGHMEHAWNTILKLTLGVMYITSNVLEHAFQSAKHAASNAAQMGHDFAFVPSAYDLAFLITVGMPGGSFELSEVKLLMQEIQAGEQRLQKCNLKDAVLLHCSTAQYLHVLKKEWEKEDKARKAVDKKKGKKNKTKKEHLEEERLQDVKPGHLPVTDWRVFDQRFFSYYTWLEPPLQPEPHKCENCGIQCLKVHRCDTCKLRGYCSSMCAAAHMFEHDCDAAPKPWLSPPVAPKQSAPAELGEEGLFGFIPWSLVRYAYLGAISYVAYHLLEAFLDFKHDHRLGFRDALSKLFDMLWDFISIRVESILGTNKGAESMFTGSISSDPSPDMAEPSECTVESLPEEVPADNMQIEL